MQLSASSVASADDLCQSLQESTGDCQAGSFETKTSRDCRELSLVDLRQSAGSSSSLQTASGSSTMSTFDWCLHCFQALLRILHLMLASLHSTSFISLRSSSRSRIRWRRRPPTQLSSFSFVIAALAALTVQGETLPALLSLKTA